MNPAQFILSDRERWPLLVRAMRETVKMETTKVEWLIDRIETCPHCHRPGHVRREAEFNYAQIFYERARRDDKDEFESLARMLDKIEECLRNGVRHADFSGVQPFTTMGGVFDLIGRWPHHDDYLSLRVLREITMRTNDRDAYGVIRDYPFPEWICEVSLLARKGDS